jgi:NADPH:quinone reductase-like Zn-dependent oxidoreductase
MQAIAIDQFGGLEKLSLHTLPMPEIGVDEALIHLKFAGVGAWDPWEREGNFARLLKIKPTFPLCTRL